jgi:hypothetical protein
MSNGPVFGPNDFERARSQDPTRESGDPERWGGHARVVTVSTRTPIPPNQTPFGSSPEQIIRAQTRDLVAVAWDLFAEWDIRGCNGTDDAGSLSLDITVGTGQASSRAWWRLCEIRGGVPACQNAGAVALGFFPWGADNSSGLFVPNNRGVAISSSPIVGTSLNARVVLQVSTAADVDHNIVARVTAHCCPRSWVPGRRK